MPKGQVKDSSDTSITTDGISTKSFKDISNVLEILDSPSIVTNPFGANLSGDNSYRRAERISAALLLVTNHVPESEPLRIATRESGLRLLERILELRSGFRAAVSEKGQSALADIRSLISQIRLLAVGGYISTHNAQSIISALDELGNLIVISQRSTLAEQVNLSRSDLMPRVGDSYRTSKTRPIRLGTSPESHGGIKKDKKGHSYDTNADGERSTQILDILRVGGELGIKDISANLPQYSEKMIQRELARLAEVGIVAKIGEKRWSKYRLAPRE